jgi:enoyl-CoA hydratase/carnithine racemase
LAEQEAVLVEVRDRKMYITFNRPEVLNAQNDAFRFGLIDAIDRFEADPDLGVALLCGSGRAFSAGADLREVKSEDAGRRTGNLHFDRLDRCRKPLVACIHGYAVGGGLEVALCCDIRLATEDALLGTPEPRTIGGAPMIAVHRLARMIPMGEALKLMLSSQPITGRRAYDIGLVQEAVADLEELRGAAERLADQILECNPVALVGIKQVVRTPMEIEMAGTRRMVDMELIAEPEYRGGERSAYLDQRKASGQGG